MDENIKIPIEFISDKKGYFDRECPNKECEYLFKVSMDDWEKKFKNFVYCPMCGKSAPKDEWYTKQQINKMQEIARNYAINKIQNVLHKSFTKIANETKNNKFLKIEYKPNKKVSFINNPIGQSNEWNLDITCNKCGTKYSVIGSAYFCPCCGYNSIESTFSNSLVCIEKMIDSLEYINKSLIEKYNKDIANDMYRSLLENTVKDIISAFQKFAKENLISKSTKDKINVRVNDFQIISKGDKLYKLYLNKSYSDVLSQKELDFINIMFQRRHILEHNTGIVDEKYIQNSNDKTYFVGERVVITKKDTKYLLKIISKLADFLKE